MKLQKRLLKLLTTSHHTVFIGTAINRFITEGRLHETAGLTTESAKLIAITQISWAWHVIALLLREGCMKLQH
jgi:hypothetical protein